ncbi:conserved Plasmodium protein, unknown function [Plasmodium berghei]|uniref:rRNA-processing protein UTP23 n=2 Tax=Plasmodium berghei TaxID=5821 RepID=A0A509ASC6_PLABA|nr:conserved protein, unknown function [Plasmodium berghei ANKA]CXJ22738.1 conserved Plasmodium protein, unknown function [Plasmodium berghei]SCM26680.1 conserved Plasmodium protein, unknown function [Plasmodium berghei]SCN28582.1 conserved Plasmodium protein, unknown function [Plasmodium berghei]SCO62770.1 conserved Plasmodium protein, unknown function [Plasmodium berghei]SCO64330.1 conserved Plasmodium protein, unknown function [Plasmodium berghei]|eukprot:XP_034424226.1 conserved protein, unknown function [Plasmodium berghei ANKA]
MKIDKKKEFKKKLITCCSLLQASEPLKIIIDETFLNICIIHKIPLKDELNKLINRQIVIMTTKCISNYTKQTNNEETAYGIRKISHYKCNHNENNIKNYLNEYIKQIKKENHHIFSPNYFFENQIQATHNFDNLYNDQIGVTKTKDIHQNVKILDPNKDHQIEENEKDEEKGKDDGLSDSMKCIIDLVKNNNEKKFFIATNNLPLRAYLRKIFLVPILYVSESGVIKMEDISTKNMLKKKNVELKKMKMLKWERDLKMAEQRKNKDAAKINPQKKKINKNKQNRKNKKNRH